MSDSERAQVVRRWLKAAPSPPLEGDERAAAVECGNEVYDRFNNRFVDFFLDPGRQGRSRLVAALRHRLGFCNERLYEAALERIKDRRLILLNGVFKKYQKTLKPPCRIEENMLDGYFVQVCRIESRNLPMECLQRHEELFPDLARPSEQEQGDGVEVSQLAGQLKNFWISPNGFTDKHRLEGLVSAGVGFLVDEEDIADRCRDDLFQRLPQWEEDRDRLRRRISRTLARWEEESTRLPWLQEDQTQNAAADAVERLESRLGRLRERLRRHHVDLLPKPRDVMALLAGPDDSPPFNVYNVRFNRIRREIELLKGRVEEGCQQISERNDLPASLHQLASDMTAHLAAEPPLVKRKDASGTKARLLQRRQRWLARSHRLLGELQNYLQEELASHGADPLSRRLAREWVADIEDWCVLGVFETKGIIGALGFRSARRMERLLREA